MTQIVFLPLVSWGFIAFLAALAVLGIGFAALKRQPGWALRALALGTLIVVLMGPANQTEERETFADKVIVLVDESESQSLGNRSTQTQTALEALADEIADLPNTELAVYPFTTDESALEDRGTALFTALNSALTQEPANQIAGIVAISDGLVHDADQAPPLKVPFHLLMTGEAPDWDRRLTVTQAPAYAILGERVTLKLRIDDLGAAPDGAGFVPVDISIDGEAPITFDVPIAREVELPIELPHGGLNVLQFSTPVIEGELTPKNNSTIVQMNGVRDRLRVLLVSGEPYPGERTWRNLLKSDAAVDLVHFTILRPPGKEDGVPVNELALIAFPTRELFLEKIDEFDLIILDRYRRRGILTPDYFQNMVNYVAGGGALLVTAGSEFGGADSIYRSALGQILPGAPTAIVSEEGYTPRVTDLGQRHPVTAGLAPETDSDAPPWGRWFRTVEVIPERTATIPMSGAGDAPLLLLDTVGEGRVALLASDQAWLWDRGFEGGGPQLELLRRTAYWLMKEPDLEEEALWAERRGQELRIIRRTLKETLPPVTVTGPNGDVIELELEEVSPGRFEARWQAPDLGFYRLEQGEAFAVIAVGPTAPKEYENTIATGDVLAPVIDATLGGIHPIRQGNVDVRVVRAGSAATGRGWIGITPREAFRTTDIKLAPLLPMWVWLVLAAALSVGAWLIEARRRG